MCDWPHGGTADRGIQFPVGDDDRCGEVVTGCRDRRNIELDQQVTRCDVLTVFDLESEVLSAELDGVETDVDEHLSTVRMLQPDRVTRREGGNHECIERSEERARPWGNCDALAQCATCEHGVGHLRERDNRAIQRAQELNVVARGDGTVLLVNRVLEPEYDGKDKGNGDCRGEAEEHHHRASGSE